MGYALSSSKGSGEDLPGSSSCWHFLSLRPERGESEAARQTNKVEDQALPLVGKKAFLDLLGLYMELCATSLFLIGNTIVFPPYPAAEAITMGPGRGLGHVPRSYMMDPMTS